MGSGLAHTLPLQLQLPKLQHGPGIRHMIQQACEGWVIASAGRGCADQLQFGTRA